jgi:hypothetical protein
MSSTFTSPIRIFKRNNPTNNGVIAPDNTGAAMCTQDASLVTAVSATTSGAVVLPIKEIGQTVATPFILPAGSIIHDIYMYQTTAPSALTGGVITVNALVTNPSTGAVTTTALGTLTPTTSGGLIYGSFAATTASAAILANVGVLDVELQFSQATVSAITGSFNATFAVPYTPRNVDGSITAYGSNYTNS